ncbi:MAG: amidohydrolase family protein [Gammaproteobacteria bacterium]|nr:amidohydrolase family protein [Gammaproteobacteria bacterium]
MDPDWLPFHPAPSIPGFRPPPGAVDAHCHVFGPADQFPFAPERKYTPCDAGKFSLFALRDHLGFSRNVIVQATCHGTDNAALVDALSFSNGLAKGIAAVDPGISHDELRVLDAAGVCGVRFNFVKRLVDKLPHEALQRVAEKIAPLNWHIVIYFEARELDEIHDLVTTLPTPVVVDHMGRPDVTQPVDGAEFAQFIGLMEDHPNFWVKVSCPERLSAVGPPTYEDVVPFCRLLVERFGDRVLWGTDWPHPNMKSHMPDDGTLVDFIPEIAPTRVKQQALLVDNPMRLYWPEEIRRDYV